MQSQRGIGAMGLSFSGRVLLAPSAQTTWGDFGETPRAGGFTPSPGLVFAALRRARRKPSSSRPRHFARRCTMPTSSLGISQLAASPWPARRSVVTSRRCEAAANTRQGKACIKCLAPHFDVFDSPRPDSLVQFQRETDSGNCCYAVGMRFGGCRGYDFAQLPTAGHGV